MLTLDEAIKHCYEVAETKCNECGKEHLQLAEWLEELKELRQSKEVFHVDYDEKPISVKKQYWISLEHNFKRSVILFEDGEPVTYYAGFEDEVAEFIEQIESEGYVKGHLQEDLEGARITYERVKDTVLPISYKELWELEEKIKNENNKTTMS